jgi:hypothetical protein
MSPVGQELEAEEARGGVTQDHISLLLGFSEGERLEVSRKALALAPAVGYRFTEGPCRVSSRHPRRRFPYWTAWSRIRVKWRCGRGLPWAISTQPARRWVRDGVFCRVGAQQPGCIALTASICAGGTSNPAPSRRGQAEIKRPGACVADHTGPLATDETPSPRTSQFHGKGRCTWVPGCLP